tara:strand:- start:86 stop:322 length:237 start_codon:yes stop_codon:yes gene_type:complete
LKISLKLTYFFLILLTITALIQIFILFRNNRLKKIEKKELNSHSEKIENCIDIENKNDRTFRENLKLSEYCIDKFGTI